MEEVFHLTAERKQREGRDWTRYNFKVMPAVTHFFLLHPTSKSFYHLPK
jgi:hypothetical protein